MANEKISGFASGAPLVSTDQFVIARAGANYSVTATNIATFVGSSFAMWQADATLATYITPISFSNQTLPGILRLGSSSTTEAYTMEWQNGGALGGGAILTSLDSGNSGYFQFFQTTNRIGQCGYSSGGRWAINSNSFTGGAVGGYTGILQMRAVDAANEAGLLISLPSSPSNTIHVLRVADSANLYHYMDNLGRSYAPNGSVSLPAWSFLNDTDCGLYRVTTNELALSTNASRLIGFNATQVMMPVNKEFWMYGTADETTNTESLSIFNASTTWQIRSRSTGTGTTRTLLFAAQDQTTGTGGRIRLRPFNVGNSMVDFLGETGYNQAINHVITSGTFNGSSGRQVVFAINPTINQTGSASWTTLLISNTVTADVGSTNYAIDVQLASSTVFNVLKTGAVSGLSYTSGAPAGGTAATAKFGVYIAGVTVPTGAVEFESGGVTYLLSAVAK